MKMVGDIADVCEHRHAEAFVLCAFVEEWD